MAVALEDLEVVLILLPGNVARVSIRNAREPLTGLALALDLVLAVGCAAIAPGPVGISTRVARIYQRTHRCGGGQRPKDRCLAVVAASLFVVSLLTLKLLQSGYKLRH